MLEPGGAGVCADPLKFELFLRGVGERGFEVFLPVPTEASLLEPPKYLQVVQVVVEADFVGLAQRGTCFSGSAGNQLRFLLGSLGAKGVDS